VAEFPALTLWTDAYLSDTRHLSTLEHGAYLLLLMEAWRRPNCDIPDDDRFLARLAGVSVDEWEAIKPVIMEFWTRDGRTKTWKQKRLIKERDAARKRSKSQRDNSAKRWNKTKKGDATGSPKKSHGNTSTATATATDNLEPSVLVGSGLLDLQGGDGEVAPVKPKITTAQAEEAFGQWAKAASERGWPVPTTLTDQRRKKLTSRLKSHGLEAWRAALVNAYRSPLLTTDPPPGWFNFDWLIKNDENLLKLLEGNYNRGADRGFNQTQNRGSERPFYEVVAERRATGAH
jgi:uncharacterized protein YdaU (DUF1376 family)